jgi:hypothetical protein
MIGEKAMIAELYEGMNKLYLRINGDRTIGVPLLLGSTLQSDVEYLERIDESSAEWSTFPWSSDGIREEEDLQKWGQKAPGLEPGDEWPSLLVNTHALVAI